MPYTNRSLWQCWPGWPANEPDPTTISMSLFGADRPYCRGNLLPNFASSHLRHTLIPILPRNITMLPTSASSLRIRENQRRSRARQKEYLQELEARLRNYELYGIEASPEIRTAANQVAEENRKLRELLLLRGIGKDKITTYLQFLPSENTPPSRSPTNRSPPIPAHDTRVLLTAHTSSYLDGHAELLANRTEESAKQKGAFYTTANTAQSSLALNSSLGSR